MKSSMEMKAKIENGVLFIARQDVPEFKIRWLCSEEQLFFGAAFNCRTSIQTW
jgi:hypothetical protein